MESTISILAAFTGHAVAFYALSALAIAAALLMVVQKNPVASVLWLVGSFVGLAGLFLIMEAYFLAVIQILVYAGAILVLFLFVIMLLDLRNEEMPGMTLPRVPVVGLAASALFLVAMIAVLAAVKPYFEESMVDLIRSASESAESADSVRSVGIALFSHWILPFEATSLLLLAAIVGSVAITKKNL